MDIKNEEQLREAVKPYRRLWKVMPDGTESRVHYRLHNNIIEMSDRPGGRAFHSTEANTEALARYMRSIGFAQPAPIHIARAALSELRRALDADEQARTTAPTRTTRRIGR